MLARPKPSSLIRATTRSGARAELMRRSLYEFVKGAWPIVDPTMPFRDNWHVGAICEFLEAVSKNQIQQGLINIPPGFAKSILVCVMYSAWEWARNPGEQMIFASYADDLVTRDSMRTRDLVQSEWYQDNFVRGNWTIRADRNRQDWFETTHTGKRQATTVGGKGTGLRGNKIIVDDPISAMDAHSEAKRRAVITWWDGTMPSRVNDPMRAAWIIIMQRLHEEDLSGHVLAQGGYEHLCLPMRFEEDRRCRVYVRKPDVEPELLFTDPRENEGELLFPGLYPEPAVARLEVKLGAEANGQLQQDPSPADGGDFKKSYWRFFKPDGVRADGPIVMRHKSWNQEPARTLPTLHKKIISLDANFKEGKKNDRNAFAVIGVNGPDRYILDCTFGRYGFPKMLDEFRRLCAEHPDAYGKYIEDKANGSAAIAVLSQTIAGIIAVNPEGGKESRAAAIQPQVQAGNVYLPEGAPWLHEFIDEFAKFPLGKHDDIVDCVSQGLIALMGSLDAARFMMLAGR